MMVANGQDDLFQQQQQPFQQPAQHHHLPLPHHILLQQQQQQQQQPFQQQFPQNHHSIQPASTLFPGLPVPPHFAPDMGSASSSSAASGVSLLTPDMSWSRVDLPAFVWFELFIRAGAVLSAAAVATNNPSSQNDFFGWQGPVGVVAPDFMWDALRSSLDRSVSFQTPQPQQTQPPPQTQQTQQPQSHHTEGGSSPISGKPATAASVNWGNSGKEQSVPAPKRTPTPTPVAAVAQTAQQRPPSSQGTHAKPVEHQSEQTQPKASSSRKTSSTPAPPSNNTTQTQPRARTPSPAKQMLYQHQLQLGLSKHWTLLIIPFQPSPTYPKISSKKWKKPLDPACFAITSQNHTTESYL
ncbi:hypothetical protein BCR33DRAFT_492497 [Rhizoclosmatium globosum]|uniref:Uncharacterized protein n=1 Tax=Rhizoclosmatium globosum TaxID=329046 RepID=A0A1Y2CUR6_9FUNG|nr:hypothetical protein BCR33DRAFT_492497 [Rhizoclosmatium globosum]|eukprot:ORY50707.1 hypothetical protein BCR33DRAFT_492497 [Rhizoclosmatium globosum]